MSKITRDGLNEIFGLTDENPTGSPAEDADRFIKVLTESFEPDALEQFLDALDHCVSAGLAIGKVLGIRPERAIVLNILGSGVHIAPHLVQEVESG